MISQFKAYLDCCTRYGDLIFLKKQILLSHHNGMLTDRQKKILLEVIKEMCEA